MATSLSRKSQNDHHHYFAVSGGGARRVLLMVEIVLGFSAVGGGIGLLINGLGMPRSTLAHSPFTDSFIGPGLLLIGVGTGLLAAAWMIWKRLPLAPLASLGAGTVLPGWIVIEALMIRSGRELQVVILAFAVLTITLSWLLRKRW